ncbi:flagellar motor protein MotA [Maricaulis sp. W15]|uniref:Outer membrane transport energization protein ExbB n=1 Tax=Maricaulis maris TaxID=74318 RepID=A0A495D106_9PROT|nr:MULTISPECIES: MotA/TolQ/ExbB proton channel family protein [Maricaulis]OLF72339.1 flagellar motor protein MotA [Maricaulis sp. W15]RKQ95188.1 outer membrane transport energization protein ExbB [Maricaulis maris]
MKTTMKMLAAAVSLGVALTAGAVAQTQPAGSLNELLNRVRSDAREASAENAARLREFQSSTNTQQAQLNTARSELAALERQATQLSADFEANQVRIDELDAELRQRQGAFGEMFGAARQAAGEFAAILNQSVISAQFPGRADALETLSNSRTLPTRAELDFIPRRVIEEMIQQQQVVTFNGRVTGLGEGAAVPITRVGPFLAFTNYNNNQRFALWGQNENTGAYSLTDMPAQPPANFISAASALFNADPNEIVEGVVDPSRGALLDIYKNVPDINERIQQSGNVGLVIIGLLVISALFGIFRMITLLLTQAAVSGQKRKSSGSKGNPLGRVMLAYEGAKDKDVETMELKLDEAILQETPKLEFGLNFLKLAAGIAPLLGLLGTVTGMIKTFTQITLFGTGDPRIMAGGISEALMTTVLGLIAAIPLLFIHSFAQSFARGVQQVLEEQAAGMIARHAEERAQG